MKPQAIGVVIIIILVFLVFRTYSPAKKAVSEPKKDTHSLTSKDDGRQSTPARKAMSLSQMEASSGGKSLLVSGKAQSNWDSFVNKAVKLFTGGNGSSQSSSGSADRSSSSDSASETSSSTSSPFSDPFGSTTTSGSSSSGSGTSGTSSSSSSSSSSSTSASTTTGSTTGTADSTTSGTTTSGSSAGTGGVIASGTSSGAGTTTTSPGTSTPGSDTPAPLVGMPLIEGKSDAELQTQGLFVIQNDVLQYVFDRVHSRIIVYDKRASHQWWAPVTLWNITVTVQKLGARELRLDLTDKVSLRNFSVTITLDDSAAEALYEIAAPNDFVLPLFAFPPFFEVGNDSELVVPISEGLLIPVWRYIDDFPKKTFLYGGPWPLPVLGVQEETASWCEIVETPNDFFIINELKSDGRTVFYNYWQNQKGSFGYNRRIRQCFFHSGGYVAIAKRVRQWASNQGLLVKLSMKNTARGGNIDKLIGAIDIWYFGSNGINFIRELHDKSFRKVLYSNARYLTSYINEINQLGFLTSRYDNYQDVWPPEVNGVAHEGWPGDLVLDNSGNPVTGWTISQNGVNYPGGVVCSYPGFIRSQQRIAADLTNYAYTARFIDTVTASPWRECYNPAHPTTRIQDMAKKMDMLNYISSHFQLVTGSEDGVAHAVPVVDYLEGMMSAGGRLPNSGYNIEQVEYAAPTVPFRRYQVGETYRIPFWELVFHDSVVTTLYWGDSTNRIPEVWWRRDLLNILYGNMPLWAIRDYAHWQQYEMAFLASYRNVSPVFEKVGYEEMLTHSFLTEDRTVQQTNFTNDITIVVNFSAIDYRLTPAVTVRAHGFVVMQNGVVWKSGTCDYEGLPVSSGG